MDFLARGVRRFKRKVKGMLPPEMLAEIPAVKRWVTDGSRSRQWPALRKEPLPDARKLELLTELRRTPA